MICSLGAGKTASSYVRESAVTPIELRARRVRMRLTILHLMTWAFTAAACGDEVDGPSTDDAPDCVESVILDPPTAVSVEPRQSASLSANVEHDCVSPLFYNWSSDDLTKATVTDNGRFATVEGVSAGSAIIRVTARSRADTGRSFVKSASKAITVTPPTVSTVAVTPPAATISVLATTILTATPTSGYGVPVTGQTISWSTAPSGIVDVTQSGNQTTVTARSPGSAVVTATALPSGKTGVASITVTNVAVLTVSPAGPGNGTVTAPNNVINCVRSGGTNSGTCSASFLTTTSITLTAVANAGSTFVGWGGACSGTGTCVVSTDQSRSVTANFEFQQTLGVQIFGSGAGTVTDSANAINCTRVNGVISGVCSGQFAFGAQVTLTAGATAGSTFTGWTGACTGAGTCTVTMNQPRVVTATFDIPGGISGTIRHSQTTNPLSNATVELRAGANATTGAPLATTTSAANGLYAFSGVAPGTYTVLVKLAGFIDGDRGGITVSNAVVASQDVVLSPALLSGQTRIVLTWGSLPEDLDSHLTGPTTTGRFHICWANEGSDVSSPFAKVDVDDVDGNGPEVTTIYSQTGGDYFFYVFNFSVAYDDPNARPLSASGARVQVFQGSARVADFPVPSTAGNLWTVFSINGSTITPINGMSNAGGQIPSGACGTLARISNGFRVTTEPQDAGKRKRLPVPPDELPPQHDHVLLPRKEH
jgi:hypothetical protein